MAGSWQHMTTKSGKLRNSETFCGMIENLGDAYEAAEECFGMVWWLARAAAMTVHDTVSPTREQVLSVIARAEAHCKDGLGRGGVQKPGPHRRPGGNPPFYGHGS